MKKLSVLVALLLVLTLGGLPAAAITGGNPDGLTHLNVGAIVVSHPIYGPVSICSGTLIGETVFLTAGHCTDYLEYLLEMDPIAEVFVSFHPDDALQTAWLPVVDVITHPDYNWGPASNPHDVGVLILEDDPGITPEQLPCEGFLNDLKEQGMLRQGREGAKFTVVGYGATLDWPPPVSTRGDGVRRVATSEFLNLRQAWLHMSQNQAPGRGDAGTCSGDSGGPTFWVDPDTEDEILVAVTSWGDAPCVATGTAYRVDIPDTLDFIDEVTPP